MQCGQGLLVYFRVHNGKFNLLSTPIEAMRLQAHGEASSGGMEHAKHPHTGVPEIGHLACAIPPSQRVARCWCLCEGGARDYRKHATVFAARLGVCRLTDFWYSSMRASDKCPAGRASQRACASHHRLALFQPGLQPNGGNTRPCDLRVFGRFDPAHAYGAEALAVLHDHHPALQHAVQDWRAQE